jgi:DNA-binding transcriptional LysR family regulator
MDLTIDQLRSVVVLAEHLHFGRAAAVLYVSQPALTKQIRKIENTLGGPLFMRKPRQLRLTRAGQVLVEHARSVIRDTHLAIDVSRSAMRGEAGVLRIGFGLSSLAVGLPEIVQRFRRRFPLVHISMRELSTPPQLEELENRTLDVGFVRLPISLPEISSIPLFTDRLMVAVQRRKGQNVRGGLKSFAREPFIFVTRAASASLHDHIIRTCHAAGFLPRVVQEVGELFTVLRFVQAGAGVALVPQSSSIMNVPGIRFLETGIPAAQWKVGVAFNHVSSSDPAVRNFLSVVRKQFQSGTTVKT